ncbi:hypothetical protein FF100_35865 [Methylobacterium terricola]|uniref:Uncharacterized protein n=1 Tax=Methylobacterium terricola TaxID=2583531 RepID=A0A5C4L7R1_9HYPH|nr:hypothetical protein [Methylobacterium terricola]TNC05289.1 hypothetical protein FF100_35865 [Methylobacterium terricola]
MGQGCKVLSDDHARALIKQAIGIVFGDARVEAEATVEIAAIEAVRAQATQKPKRIRPPA